MMVAWSYASFAFFVVPYYLAQADEGVNFYLMNICLAVAEIIASIILLILTSRMNLKKALILFNLMALSGTIGILVFEAIYKG
jgi:hypothetical protein